MILLDTNVVSEPLRGTPDHHVVEWLNAQPAETLYLSTISVAELRLGVALLPTGKRKTRLHEDIEQRLLPIFSEHLLTFDLACTQAYAELVTKTRNVGRPIVGADAYIAAIALTHGVEVATRDTAPFEAAGLRVINPWKT